MDVLGTSLDKTNLAPLDFLSFFLAEELFQKIMVLLKPLAGIAQR